MRSNQNTKTCIKCKEDFIWFPEEAFWDERGYGYSTKLTKCPYCNCINIIKTIEDYGFNVNNDIRFYK